MSSQACWDLALTCLSIGAKWTAYYLVFCTLFHLFRIHERFGIFRTAEPRAHFRAALKMAWVPFLWGIGLVLTCSAIGLNLHTLQLGESPALSFTLPERFVFLHSPTLTTDILFAVLGFYVMDLLDWLAHRINHYYDTLYKKFPVGHFLHHNFVFVNPMVVVHSPLVHLAQLSGMVVYVLLLSQGLIVSTLLLHLAKVFTNFLSHLGCDPLPWLTRLNHRVGGWIPWIPLHHQYHHLPFARQGNYGNITCLWDYVFGTVCPECVYHIENGRPLPHIAQRMADAEVEMAKYLKGKTQLNME